MPTWPDVGVHITSADRALAEEHSSVRSVRSSGGNNRQGAGLSDDEAHRVGALGEVVFARWILEKTGDELGVHSERGMVTDGGVDFRWRGWTIDLKTRPRADCPHVMSFHPPRADMLVFAFVDGEEIVFGGWAEPAGNWARHVLYIDPKVSRPPNGWVLPRTALHPAATIPFWPTKQEMGR